MKALWTWLTTLGASETDMALLEKEFGTGFLSWKD